MTHEFDRAQVVHNDLGNWLCLHIKNAPMARVECEQLKEGKTYTAEVKKKYDKRSGRANGINGQQNGNGDFSAGLQGRPDGTAFDSAVPNRGSNDGRANSGLSDGVLLTSKKTRQIMDERGLPNLGLKESTGDNTSFSYALDAAQVDETQTIPRFAVDDAGNPNGGLSDAEMQWAKLLAANQEKTGVSIQQLTHEIVDSTFEEYNQALQSAEQYVRDYTPQGTSVVRNADGTSFRASNNEKWYSDYYKKNGKAPSRAEAAQVAAQLVKADIQRGGGQFISAELAQDLQTALEIQAAANALGENVISAQVVDGNLVVQRGKPAHTANIQNPYDINPKLTRAGETQMNGGTAGTYPFGQNTVGAAQSAYAPEQKVSKVSSNTFANSTIFNDAEKQSAKIFDQDGDALYDVVTEKQSLDNARQRFDRAFFFYCKPRSLSRNGDRKLFSPLASRFLK